MSPRPTSDTFEQLRSSFDGQDPFMTRGHQILRPRVLRQSDRNPELTDNREVREILARTFPNLRKGRAAEKRAARWMGVIQMYFRMCMTSGQVADEMRIKRKTVENTVASIRRVVKKHRAKIGPRRRGFVSMPLVLNQ
jgi:hypothetical protein